MSNREKQIEILTKYLNGWSCASRSGNDKAAEEILNALAPWIKTDDELPDFIKREVYRQCTLHEMRNIKALADHEERLKILERINRFVGAQ